ncbi:MAG: hypothetical protein AAB583_06890 [Patescibacteria group bacterium]
MLCEICGSDSVYYQGKVWCPSCKIFLADDEKENTAGSRSIPREYIAKFVDPPWIQLFRFLLKTSVILSIIIFIIFVLGYLFFHTGSLGYREKLMDNYGFTEKAKWQFRFTTWLNVAELSNKDLPKVFVHSRYDYRIRVVFVGSANDELAIHEMGHAWWMDKTKDNEELKKQYVLDLIRLSEMKDKDYLLVSKFAKFSLWAHCSCPDKNNINYGSVDDGHLFVYIAAFTMGKYKDGSRKLPPFMWKYFKDLFTGTLKVKPCYETNTCQHIQFDPDKAFL